MSPIEFQEVESVHRMGWCASFDDDVTRVIHGSWVETFDHGFVEGAWSGCFADKDFAGADIFLGSGAVSIDSTPLLSSASHPYEPLYSTRGETRLLVSNSLPLLCAIDGSGPLGDYPFYMHDLSSFTRGLNRSVKSVPTSGPTDIRIHRNSLLEVSSNLSVTEKRRPPLQQIDSFEEYRRFVSTSSRTIAENASASGRDHTFSPLATISSGYDSPATAVFAREAGATNAITFGTGREVFGPESDAGDEIARIIGLEATEYDRLQYRHEDGLPEADFMAVGTGAEDVVFASLADELAGSVLFTGFAGDSLWARHHPDPTRSLDFATGDRSGSSLSEFRLRAGFIHFPVPLATYTMHPSLHRISNSPEMEPWSVGDRTDLSREALLGRAGPAYDRPIPRRIAEEEGVPRELFGQKKRAVSQPFYHDEDLAEIMSSRSLEDFRAFLREEDLPPGGIRTVLHRVAATLYRVLEVPFKLVRKLSLHLGRPLDVSLPWPDRYREPLTENLYTFHWALDRVRRRYEQALRRAL